MPDTPDQALAPAAPAAPAPSAPVRRAGGGGGGPSIRYQRPSRERISGASADPTAMACILWGHLADAHAAVEAHVVEALSQHGLSLAEFGVLEALRENGPTKLGQLRRVLSVSSGGVTFLIDRLERRGLVERQTSPRDRRARFAALTAAGNQALDDAGPVYGDRIRESVSSLSLAEQRGAIGLLRALARDARALSSPTAS